MTDAPPVPDPARHPWPGSSTPWIACAVSGSPSSLAGIRWALREARRRDAWLVVVRVWTGTSGADRASCERDLVDEVADAVDETGVHGRTFIRLVDGRVDDILSSLAVSADLLVVGSHAEEGQSDQAG